MRWWKAGRGKEEGGGGRARTLGPMGLSLISHYVNGRFSRVWGGERGKHELVLLLCTSPLLEHHDPPFPHCCTQVSLLPSRSESCSAPTSTKSWPRLAVGSTLCATCWVRGQGRGGPGEAGAGAGEVTGEYALRHLLSEGTGEAGQGQGR